MPFQSEKQRRYLWANEPEIARDWADTYGSRIESNRGGITRTAFGTGLTKEYQDFENWYKARNKFQRQQTLEELKEDYYKDKELQKTQNQKSMVATGGLMSMQGGVQNHLGHQKEVTAPLNWQSSPDHPTTELAYITEPEKDLLVKQDLHNSLKGGVNRGPSGIMSLNGWGSSDPEQNRAGADISAAMDTSASDAGWSAPGGFTSPHAKSPAELSLLAGKKGSTTVMPGTGPLNQGFFGNLKDKIFQGRGDYEDQTAWQEAKDERIGQKRIDRILNRSDEFPITENTYKNLMDAGWEGGLPALKSTATSRGDRNTYEGIRGVDVPQDKLVEVAQTGLETQADAIPISGQNDYWNALNMKPMNINMSEAQKEKALLELGRGVDPHIIMPKLQQDDPTKFFMKTDERIKSKEFIDFLEKEQNRKLSEDEKRRIYKAAKEEYV